MFVLAERIDKKSAPGKFYKQAVQNISCFNKNIMFAIKKINKWKNIKKPPVIGYKAQKLINIYSKDSKEMRYFQL